MVGINPHFKGQHVSDVKKEYLDFLEKYATKQEIQELLDRME